MTTQRRWIPPGGCRLAALLIAALIPTTDLPYVARAAEAADADAAAVDGDRLLVYVGTYTRGGKSQGIYRFILDLSSGELTPVGVTEGVDNPSFLVIHPSGKFLYCVTEIADFDGKKTGGVAAFSIDPQDGALRLMNAQPSGGAAPCHLVVDDTGKNVLVANYTGGSVACLPIKEDGRLGEATAVVQHEGSSVDPRRQSGPHAHSINLDRQQRFAIAADLGLDKLLVYRFDPTRGSLTPNDPPGVSTAPGAGPRHFTFDPSGRFGYVINELNLTVTAFAYDPETGTFDEFQTIATVPADAERAGLSTAEVRVHPSGRFLYGSNRGHDTIVVYSIDPETGRLTHVENEPTGGRTPRNFFIEPTGKFLLAENQSTDSIVVFAIDPKTGELSPTGHQVEVPSPVCIRTLELPE